MGALHEGHLNLGMSTTTLKLLINSKDESRKSPFDGNDTLCESNASTSIPIYDIQELIEVRPNGRSIEISKNTSSRFRTVIDPLTRIQGSDAKGDRGEPIGDL